LAARKRRESALALGKAEARVADGAYLLAGLSLPAAPGPTIAAACGATPDMWTCSRKR
jgi:hypothetical protein